MTPEERIRANVMKALGQQQKKQPVKKQNIFVSGVLKSTSRTKSTDLSEIEEICNGLPLSNSELAALTLVCAHNNSQVRERIKEASGEDIGPITADEMALATGEIFTPLDFSIMITELMACGVLALDDDGFYRVTLYGE